MKYREKITVWGVVQGVGFRPFISRLAREFNLSGNVRNSGGIVEIEVSGLKKDIEAFAQAIRDRKPGPAEIMGMTREEISDHEVASSDQAGESGQDCESERVDEGSFEIIKSDGGRGMATVLPADIGICDSCLEEIRNVGDRRYAYAYNSCTVCGPRYSIIDRVPYDRDHTSMRDYDMCENCQSEYTAPDNKRYHAQTISCHQCGPYPIYVGIQGGDLDGDVLENEDGISQAIEDIEDGKVLCLKGNGGYYLACRAGDGDAVRKLREIKGREEKPFAVMFKDVVSLEDFVEYTREEGDLLRSSARPIILLKRKDDGGRISQEVYKGSHYQGVFLPSLGIQDILVGACGPLVMTSANKTDMPIIKDDEEALAFARAEGIPVLYNTRKIVSRLDDSVIRIIDGQRQMVRRSKGYVPAPVYIESMAQAPPIFASGGDLKSTYALTKKGFTYVSEFFGDLDSLEKQEVYKESYRHMTDLFDIKPALVVSDMHPGYHTRGIASEIAEEASLPVLQVQHHHAHIGSVMAEHDLKGPVIGISFDGTGYGTDGNIWGGEVLICHDEKFDRFSHLEYIDLAGGDQGAKDCWKAGEAYRYRRSRDHWGEGAGSLEGASLEGSAGSEEVRTFSIDIEGVLAYYEDYVSQEESPERAMARQSVRAAIDQGINTYRTSSMGRLFDGVSSLLGVCHFNSYEGEGAIMLENAATDALEGSESEKDLLALAFHRKVARAILEESKKARDARDIRQVALSGGVFQNKILMEEALRLLRDEGFEVYYNISVPTNDGGICLGQAYIGMKSMEVLSGAAPIPLKSL